MSVRKPLALMALLALQLTAQDPDVLIRRDRWGVPHISGNSARAVAFGSGSASSPKWKALRRSTRISCSGCCSFRRSSMPAGTAARDVAIYVRFTILRNGMGVALQEMGGGAGPVEGSNAWAIAGSRSASGRAMLLADPHLPWQSDVQWYESHLRCPEFDIAGAAFLGMPVPSIGHNGEIAWTATNNGADTADLYLEKIDLQNPDRYLDSDGQWKLMERRVFSVEVRQPDGSLKNFERAIRYTSRGRYFSARKGREVSVAIAGWKDFPDPLMGSLKRAAARDLRMRNVRESSPSRSCRNFQIPPAG